MLTAIMDISFSAAVIFLLLVTAGADESFSNSGAEKSIGTESGECFKTVDGIESCEGPPSATILTASGHAASDNCVGRCGDKLDKSKTCQCNEQCTRFGDCCSDYSSNCLDTDNCIGRCGDKLDKTKTCQCNEQCTRFGDCCPDYTSTCSDSPIKEITDAELLELGDVLWAADNQRFLSSDLTLDISTSGRLFSFVNETKLRTPSYALFIDLLDNYHHQNNEEEPPLTSHEQFETDQFLDHVLASDVMKVVEDVLVRAGKVASSAAMKDTLVDLWFDFYGRSTKLSFADSSGFEHVFVGEKKSTEINGFHSWVQMYELEKTHRLTYLGYNTIQEPNLMEIRLEWDGLPKDRASMFIGTSPEFEMALYTLCMLAKPGQDCKTSIEGNDVVIQTYDISHVTGLQVATAFPKVR